MSQKPVIARLDIPADALVLYEAMVVREPDRTGNWRYVIHNDGCFFNARNTQLFIQEAAQFTSDNPKLFWNTPFTTQPDRCLTPAQQRELRAAITAARIPELKDYYPSVRRSSSPLVERWSVVLGDTTHTIVIEDGATPPELATLKTIIDTLVAEAPHPM